MHKQLLAFMLWQEILSSIGIFYAEAGMLLIISAAGNPVVSIQYDCGQPSSFPEAHSK